MARALTGRYLVTGTLVAETPLHVGGLGSDPVVDLSLAQDGQGRYYIPGTSLAGALRAWFGEGAGSLWGFQQGDEGHASFLLVEDAVIEGGVPEIRDGVGIDRVTGTAAEGIKFDRAVLPKGTKIPLHITIEQQETAISDALKGTLAALEAGEISLGAAKTRGLGKVILTNTNVKQQDFGSFEGMLAVLQKQGTDLKPKEYTPTQASQRPRLGITIDWEPVGPLMVKAETEGVAVDTLPLTSQVDGKLSFVIPGSSIKGALRAQAERIIRTLLGKDIPDLPDGKQRFLAQTKDLPLVREIFGEAARLSPEIAPGQSQREQLGYLGALKIDDCYTKEVRLTFGQWQAIATAETEDDLVTALQKVPGHTQQAFHVAIDRWTGGAADSFLYSTLEPMNIPWQPLRLQLDLTRAGPNPALPATLLLLLLRDLSAGRIPLGYGVNRGLGAIKVSKINFMVQGETALAPLHQVSLIGGKFHSIQAFCQTLDQSWQTWLDDQVASTEVSA